MKTTAIGALAFVCTIIIAAAGPLGAEPAPIQFSRDVRPILSQKCFACHGPDEAKRKSGLRLDLREGALAERPSGRAIAAGDPAASLVYRRITASDPGERMPPESSGQTLSASEIEVLRRWILEGADYRGHWAFAPLAAAPLPEVRDRGWARGPADRFILQRLEREGQTPSREAPRETLIRRLSLDLAGLPPEPADVDRFLADPSPDAFERAADRLLAAPQFGERLALDWLDASRFADTNGYHIDNGRDMTRWREWVIDAFNRGMPFDRFTIEQIAGDLLPGAGLEARIASGFHRNHMINFEGGAFPEEYHTAYIVDRVNTTAAVWLGLTVACAQCHDHKYDPITQKDFYQLFAFFNNVPENGLDGRTGNSKPFIQTPTPEEEAELEKLSAALAALERRVTPDDATDEGKKLLEERKRLKEEKTKLEARVRTTMVMDEMPAARQTFFLVRGQYDKKGDAVAPGVPASLAPLPEGAPANRLGLAQWLVDPAQPLTPRVIANRYWQMLFGIGLVKTAEDFGSQGEYPSHPELLDWLARRLVSTGWDVKGLIRMLVASAAYRQAAGDSAELLGRDPENRLLARAPRLRLAAELIRDQALAAAGLIDLRLGGRSVSPYHPPGLWEELASREDGANWTAQVYKQDHGADLYRRTMYTFWKRTSPPPALMAFDAPDRETCTVRRPRTNTPLQALILMNDPTYVEAARKLAERILREAGPEPAARIALAWRLVLSRRPSPAESAALAAALEAELAHYRKHPEEAAKLLGVGESPRAAALDAAELAAWSFVASLILNLDEAVTRG
jgi:hypothetical protein